MENNALTNYMSKGIQRIIKNITWSSLNNFSQMIFLLKFNRSNKKAQKIRFNYESKHQHIPPFLIASIATSCNLFCKGCYARANASCNDKKENDNLNADQWDCIFRQSEELGISFILLAGGEPLMRPDVIKVAAKYQKIIFPIFTNGTLINDNYLKILTKSHNLIPVLSIEGNQEQTDNRRGKGVYDQLISGMKKLSENKILFGSSITITTKNILDVTSNEFIRQLQAHGCKIIFFIEYVPIDKLTRYLAPDDKERDILSSRQAELRKDFKNILFLSFPGDEKELGGCLASGRGFFHINAAGGAEPCPFAPYSDINLKDHSLLEVLNSPLFKKITAAHQLWEKHSGGCLLFEKEEEVKQLLLK